MAETIEELQLRLALFEQNGPAKMYYALNRKMNEIADLLNSTSLKSIDMASNSDKSFERVFKLLEKSETISNAAKSLGEIAGVSGDEAKDINRSRRATTPESMAQDIGDYKTQNV